MIKKTLVCSVATFILVTVSTASAQQPAKIPRVGFLSEGSHSSTSNPARIGAFREGLRQLGYVEGKNIYVEYRYVEGKSERRPVLLAELIQLKVDLLVVTGDLSARAATKATATIPVVMASTGNPIGAGVATSLARPGGNVTGLSNYSGDLVGKRLELLKEVVPHVAHFAFFNSSESATGKTMFNDAQVAAKALGIKIHLVEVNAQKPDIDEAFRVMGKEGVGAFSTTQNPLINFYRNKIFALADKNRIPAIHPEEEWVNDGGLMSYGTNIDGQYRRAAVYVDKILKGAKPAELPVEQPTKFDFVVNLKAAKQIGLTIPPNVLVRANRVIR